MNCRKIVTGILGLAGAALVNFSSGDAHALTTTCTVSQVAWSPTGGGTLQVLCGGSWFYAFGSHASCNVQDIETRKQWNSLAQAAALTGRTININYTGCSGGNALDYMRLQ
jgi:hypothetical protein